MTGLGDVDGDGYADLALGASSADTDDLKNAGQVWLHRGPITSGGEADAWATWVGDAERQALGTGLEGAGDADGDGRGDVLIGAGAADGGAVAWLLTGLAAGSFTPADATATFYTEAADWQVGWVGPAGDHDGDGIGDILVGQRDGDEATAGLYLGGE